MDLLSLVLLAVIAATLAAFYFVFVSFLWGAGYQPAPRRTVEAMLRLGEVGPADRLWDLGAGTGAILFRAARERGARVVGVEMEPLRILILRLRRRLGRHASRIEIRWGNLYDQDLAGATVVTLFLWPEAMSRLRPVLESRLAPGTRVVSHWHRMPGWAEAATDRETRVFLYRVPTRPPPNGRPQG